MKIGILTFPDVINHGAYLQLYALSETIQAQGHQTEIIHYRNFRHWLNEYRAHLLKKNPSIIHYNLLKIRRFSIAQRKLNMQGLIFSSKRIASEAYDAIVVGSDIVWNFESPFLGHDPIYFGHGLRTKKLFSYAPSIGYADPDNNIPEYVVSGLQKFNYISVRDENSSRLVKNAIGKDAQVVLDPTFLYDYNGEEIQPQFEKFVVVYEIEQVKSFAKRHRLQLVSVAYYHAWCDHNVIALDPFEWLGYFKHASYVVTSMGHGVMFSVKYNKQFCVSMNEFIESKLATLFSRLGLRSQVLGIENGVGGALYREIDYQNVNIIMNEMIGDSMTFLAGALDG